MKALIVDDIEINRELLALFLEGRAAVTFAESGEEALQQVKDALGSNDYFDLICMDISMTGIDGLEALRLIREAEQVHGAARAIVFMVTSSSSPDDMINALVVGGCDDYLVKPLMQQSFQELLVKYRLA
ncbi:MAG: response regulator [Desulfuromonadaceae bacterium]|nr:response regulator [Desulfuromonadaceae bacterium]